MSAGTGGPEPPEETPGARDAEPDEDELARRRAGRGESARERGENGNGEEEQEPEQPPIKGTAQMTLGGLGRRGLPVSSQISIMSKTHPIDGMIKADEEVTLVIRTRVNKYEYTPERNGLEVVGFAHTHQLRVMEVARAGTDHAAVLLAADEGGAKAAEA